MNPSTDQPLPPLQLIPPPQPPQPHRSSFSCDRHPSEQYTGFCPTCLCERLTTLDHSSASSSSRRPSNANSSTAAALKAIFRIPGGSAAAAAPESGIRGRNKASSASSFLPELRRTKSFSASKNEGFSGVFEPQRRSCDVRGRSTLWNLFNQDDVRKSISKNDQLVEVTSGSPVLESKEEEEHDEENDDDDDDEISDGGDEIRVSEETNVINVIEEPHIEEEIVSIDHLEEEEEVKTMKDHIDLDSQTKKPSGMDLKEIAGSVWAAASVFSKKWNKWRRHKNKQKLKKHNADGVSSVALPVDKPISRQFHETQSEIADYGFGRRSCDTDPRFSLDAGRFSLDAGRMSFEDPRYSFDEPRASWDGYLIGRTFPRLPPILSVLEDPPPPAVHISRSDTEIPVEEEEPINGIIHERETETVPGGTAQTRDYYLDSTTSRRRKSLDRSNSIRKTAAAVVAEIDEMKTAPVPASNAKVSPTTLDYIPGNHRDSNSNSSETFELGFNGDQQQHQQQQKSIKKSRRWMKAWNIWGFIHRKNNNNNNSINNINKEELNGVQRSFSETWPDQRGFNPRVLRSNSSVSSRNSYNLGLFGSMRKHQQGSSSSVLENNSNSNGHGKKKKKKEEFVLERNRSARYSPNDAENGLLRFYLTPLRSNSGRRVPSKLNNSHSIARSVLRLY